MQGGLTLKVMVIVKATKETEAGIPPGEELLTKMTQYNEALVAAGVMAAGEGLHSSAKGKRVKFSGSSVSVTDGPFAETKELIAGYWIWNVKSMNEAVEWAKKCPNPTGAESELEIRQVFESEDFGEAFTPELREKEEKMRQQIVTKN